MFINGKILLVVLRSRACLLGAVGAACLAAGLAYGLLGPDSYRAVATLFIDPAAYDAGAGGAVLAARGSDLDLLRSERVAQRVAENERLIEAPALRPLYLESIDNGRPPMEVLAQYLAAHVDVRAGGEGGVVRVAVTMNEPQLAARVANAYAQAWGEVSLELRTASIRTGIERAHQDLVSLRARLGEARSRRGDDGALAAASSRADDQFAQLSRLSSRSPHQHASQPLTLAAVVSDPVRSLSALLPGVSAQAGRADDDTTLPAVIDARAARAADGAGDPEISVKRTQTGSSADDEIRLAQQSLERAEERLTRLAVDGIGAPFPTHVLLAARVPETSTKPGLALCSALGAVLGLVLGLLAVAIAELTDRRVRRSSDVARGLGIVVLGSLPTAPKAVRSAVGKRPSVSGRLLRLQRSGGAA